MNNTHLKTAPDTDISDCLTFYLPAECVPLCYNSTSFLSTIICYMVKCSWN